MLDLIYHIDAEFTKLAHFGIKGDESARLVSDELKYMFDAAFKIRQYCRDLAFNTEPYAICVCYIWTTMQTHTLMKELCQHELRNHPAIASAYVGFLTEQLGSTSSTNMSPQLKSLEAKVAGHVTTATFNKFETRFNKYRDANDWKER